ncbi:MAG: hypothetical protein IV100_33460 [Myxococcales bacterium]|nr:hypothetical protein [Myxococcales bacterium]
MTRLVCSFAALLLLLGCASTPLVSDDGYQHPTFPYRIAWKDKAKRRLLSPEWRVRNITKGPDGGEPTLKTGREWESTYTRQSAPDEAAESIVLPSVDLAFTPTGSAKAPVAAVVTIRTFPIDPSPGGGDEDLAAAAVQHVARLERERALGPWVRPGTKDDSDALPITVTVRSSRVRKVSGRPAVQIEMSLHEARGGITVVRNATAVIVFTQYRYDPDGPVDRTRRPRGRLYPVLLSVVWVGSPESAPDSWHPELDELLARFRFGPQEIGEAPKARAGTVNPMGGDSDGFDWP